MTVVTRYAIRFPDGQFLLGKGGKWNYRKTTPEFASLWQRKATATVAANWFKSGAEVIPVEVHLP